MCTGADDVIDYSEEGFLKKIKMPDLGQGKKVGTCVCYICEYAYTHMIMVGTCMCYICRCYIKWVHVCIIYVNTRIHT